MATDWITLNKTGGTHNDEVTVTPQPNYSSNSRSVNIIISTSEKSKTVTVYQEGYEIPTNQIIYFAPNRLSENTWTGSSTSGYCFSPAVLTNHTFSDGIGVLTFDRDVTKLGQYTFAESDASTITGLILPKTAVDWEFELERLQIDTIVFQGTKSEAYKILYGTSETYSWMNIIYVWKTEHTLKDKIKYISCDDGIIDILNEVQEITYIADAKLPSILVDTNKGLDYKSFYPNIRNDYRITGQGSTYFNADHTYEYPVGKIQVCPSLKLLGNFVGCTNLRSVNIPSSVEGISPLTFSGCSSLSSVTFANNSTIEMIPNGFLYNCGSITGITLPSNLKSIGFDGYFMQYPYVDLNDNFYSYALSDNSKFYIYNGVKDNNGPKADWLTLYWSEVGAFVGTNLYSIVIPNSVEYICRNSFAGIHNLSSVTFSTGVKYIGEKAFYDDYGLAYDGGVHYNGTRKDWFNIPKTNDSFYRGTNVYCSDKSFKLNEDTGKITYLSSSKLPNLNGTTYNMYSDGFGTMDGSITNSAFTGNSGLTSIMCTIGNNTSVFEDCTSLESVALNVGDTIGKRCFYNCSSLKNIIIPKSTKYIKESAFENCTDLKNVYIYAQVNLNGNLVKVETRAFANCSSIFDLHLPNATFESYAFTNCTNLKKVYFYGVLGRLTNLGTGCFSGCTSLNFFWGALNTIEDDVFNGCNSLTEIGYAGTVSEWNNMTKTANWNRGSSISVIHCSDGDINL